MIFIKYILIFFIIGIFSYIGNIYSKKYINREKELEKFNAIFNILKTKIQFTYKPLNEVFLEIYKDNPDNIGNIFKEACENMKEQSIKDGWEKAVRGGKTSLTKDDLEIILDMRKSAWFN